MHRRVEVAVFAAGALLFAGLACAFTGPGGDGFPMRNRTTAEDGDGSAIPREWSHSGTHSGPVLHCAPREWSEPPY
ncbi:MAG: hypothetical protein QG608_1349 [Actinomycetota bacterium]|nr:hypothetical protein [Actinomycetota bacterium]